jgi:uncharacterized protein Usg
MPHLSGLIRTAETFGLTTAQIVYHVPDRFDLLQEFIWQEFDLFPDFPALCKFLAFWEREIEGALHSVTVAHAKLIKPAELAILDGQLRLH